MTITADDFVNRVLSKMPTATPRREQIAMELRGHISERVERGRATGKGLEHLGDPVALAGSVPVGRPPDRRGLLVACDRPSDRLRFAGRAARPGGLPDLVCHAAEREWVPVLLLIYAFVGGATIAIYPMAAEASTGKTLGKLLRGLRVVTESGMRIGTGQAVVRNLPWLLSRCGGSTRCLRCSPTGTSGRSSCCRRHVS